MKLYSVDEYGQVYRQTTEWLGSAESVLKAVLDKNQVHYYHFSHDLMLATQLTQSFWVGRLPRLTVTGGFNITHVDGEPYYTLKPEPTPSDVMAQMPWEPPPGYILILVAQLYEDQTLNKAYLVLGRPARRQLYLPSLPNVYNDGMLCLGNNYDLTHRIRFTLPDPLAELVKVVESTPFGVDLVRDVRGANLWDAHHRMVYPIEVAFPECTPGSRLASVLNKFLEHYAHHQPETAGGTPDASDADSPDLPPDDEDEDEEDTDD